MINPKELYARLSACFKDKEKYSFVDRGEGMMQGWERSTSRIFLLNKNTHEAWELLDAARNLSLWNASDVEIAAAIDLPEPARSNALRQEAPYYFGVNMFRGGVASISWTLQPDGIYYADEDGFGVEDDVEINFHAFIDKKANVLIPFQSMEGALKERYRRQAASIARNPDEVPYVCLDPALTVPFSENRNLAAHRDKLLNLVIGMMFRFAAYARSNIGAPGFNGELGIVSAINPDPKKYLSLTICGLLSEGTTDTFDIHILTGFMEEGEEPQGCNTPMGKYTAAQIQDMMNIRENATIILDDFLESVNLILA